MINTEIFEDSLEGMSWCRSGTELTLALDFFNMEAFFIDTWKSYYHDMVAKKSHDPGDEGKEQSLISPTGNFGRTQPHSNIDDNEQWTHFVIK